MVVVLKPTGEVRDYVDFTVLNHHVLRECHPIPSVEHTVGLLHGAKIISKLEANSGFFADSTGRRQQKTHPLHYAVWKVFF